MDKYYTERMRWACRRGMLELDLFLVPFFDHCYDGLSSDDKKYFEVLLGYSDPELLAIMMAHQAPAEMELIPLVDKIRAFKLSGKPDLRF